MVIEAGLDTLLSVPNIINGNETQTRICSDNAEYGLPTITYSFIPPEHYLPTIQNSTALSISPAIRPTTPYSGFYILAIRQEWASQLNGFTTVRNISVSISPCETAVWDPIIGLLKTETQVGDQVTFDLYLTVNNNDAGLMAECTGNSVNYGEPLVTFAYDPPERMLNTTRDGDNLIVKPLFGDVGDYTLLITRQFTASPIT